MRGAFSKIIKKKTEESPILKKALLRIFALTVCAILLFYVFFNSILHSPSEVFSLKRFLQDALIPAIIGAFCATSVFSNAIYHVKQILEELMQESPDWLSLENEYIESDIKGLYIAIRKLHDKLSDQEKLEKAYDETRHVLAKLNTRMDEERRLIARQLHDEVNPKLILCNLELEKLLSSVNNTAPDHQLKEKTLLTLKTLSQLINDVYKNSRDIISNTRIEIIDSIGLTAALESLVHHYKKILDKPSISFEHNLQKRPDIPNEASINIYRITQEALLNVIKHAQASQAKISIFSSDDGFIKISILDDGIGITDKNHPGIGLIDMRERARTLSSTLLITNTRPGTMVSFTYHK